MIFLDVGAHEGQTLQEVTHPDYGFDTIHAFEPMPDQYATIVDLYAGRVELHNFGLADRTERRDVYGTNAIAEASIYPGKTDVDAGVVTSCEMVRASEWFAANIQISGTAVVKLNCEGAEVPILLDLCDSGEIHKAHRVMIDFDIRKVPELASLEDKVRRRLDEVGFDGWVLCENTMHGATHQDRTRAWLRTVGISR